MNGSVEVIAPAKVNLWLRVLAREESGFHSLESLFAAVSLADRIIIERTPAAGVELIVRGDGDFGPTAKNLVYRAATAFLASGSIEGGVRIELEKVIPTAAGLGGGSADAGATLRGMNELFGEPLAPTELLQIGIGLGSDVPFFLTPAPFALGWGRGERLLTLEPLPARQVLIAHPGEAMPTGDAFRRLAEIRGATTVPESRALTQRDLGSWSGVAALSENDFERPAFERIPRLAEAKKLLMEAGASMALLAGSGASMFGIFESSVDLAPVAADLESRGWQCWRERTIERWPIPAFRD